jgi:hypothetical protein
MRRCSEFATTSFTSSTPRRAAISRTCSMTRPRMSGVCIGGRGIEMSSMAIVSRMPGLINWVNGSELSGFSSAWRMVPVRSLIEGRESGG